MRPTWQRMLGLLKLLPGQTLHTRIAYCTSPVAWGWRQKKSPSSMLCVSLFAHISIMKFDYIYVKGKWITDRFDQKKCETMWAGGTKTLFFGRIKEWGSLWRNHRAIYCEWYICCLMKQEEIQWLKHGDDVWHRCMFREINHNCT
jgi:hypothetical protein